VRDFLPPAAAPRPKVTHAAPGMASNAGLIDEQEKAIAVAIDAQFDKLLDLPRRFAFAP
jgi:hypothetical protein